MVLRLEDFNNIGKLSDGFGARNVEGRMLHKVCNENIFVMQTLGSKKRKATYRTGANKTETDFVWVRKNH